VSVDDPVIACVGQAIAERKQRRVGHYTFSPLFERKNRYYRSSPI
jgi:hypothetical protein